MATSEAQKKANAKWQKKVYRYKHVKLHISNDRAILDWLAAKNQQGITTNSYLKQLIIDDMKRQAQ